MRRFTCFLCIVTIALLLRIPMQSLPLTAFAAASDASRVYLPVVAVNDYAPPIKVVETVLSRSKSGNYFFAGNLQNQGPDTVYGVGVRVHFYDEHSQLLQTYTTTAVLPANFPGQYNPFYLSTPINTFDFPNAIVETQVISWTLTTSITYGQLTLVSSSVEGTGDPVRVQAVFRNDTPYTLTDLQPLVWELHLDFYNASPLPASLPPGGSFEYTVDLYGVYGNLIPLIKIEGQGVAAP